MMKKLNETDEALLAGLGIDARTALTVWQEEFPEAVREMRERGTLRENLERLDLRIREETDRAVGRALEPRTAGDRGFLARVRAGERARSLIREEILPGLMRLN